MEAEQERLARLSVLEREVQRERLYIVDELLTLKCPREGCRQAFVDFSGCFALTCGRCQCGFCAWCLKDCGGDAHQHVGACPENRTGDVYGRAEAFDHAQIERRKRFVREYLIGLPEVVQVQVVQQCRKDFEDMQMDDVFREFQGAAAAGGLDDRLDFDFDIGQLEADQRDFEIDEQMALQLQFGDV